MLYRTCSWTRQRSRPVVPRLTRMAPGPGCRGAAHVPAALAAETATRHRLAALSSALLFSVGHLYQGLVNRRQRVADRRCRSPALPAPAGAAPAGMGARALQPDVLTSTPL